MWIETTPSIIMLAIVGCYIKIHRQQPVLLIYAMIMVSYLNLFPMLNYLLSEGQGMESFGYYQGLVAFFFQLPLLITAHFASRCSIRKFTNNSEKYAFKLSKLLPCLLIILLCGFWYVAFRYDLFYRRLGHVGLQRNTAEVPALLLFVYRSAVETSFFVLIFIWTTLHYASEKSRYYVVYKWTLIVYLISFGSFYVVNSRMHIVILLFCAFCTQPNFQKIIQKRISFLTLVLALVAILIGLTMLRELVLEDNYRVDTDNLVSMFLAISRLIAARLDSLYILQELDRAGFDALRFDLTGIEHSVSFNLSFFLDPAMFSEIKESMVTSPSVVIVNRLLNSAEVDFPKSMALDMFLSFGVLGLVLSGLLLGSLIGYIQRRISSFQGFKFEFLVCLYSLPMLLEFEKEFLGFMSSFLKWLIVLLIIYWLRPHFNYKIYKSNTILSNSRLAP